MTNKAKRGGHKPECIVHSMGASGEVTGSFNVVRFTAAGGTPILFAVDAGLSHDNPHADKLNRLPHGVKPKDLSFVVLTHTHIDHSGYLPRLRSLGFEGKVYATPATIAQLQFMLPDSGRLQERSHKLYTEQDAIACLTQLVPLPMNRETVLADQLTVTPLRAGHVLGAAMMKFSMGRQQYKRRLVFAGNFGRTNEPFLWPREPIGLCDWLFTESTYGGKFHSTRKAEDVLCDEVNAAYQRALQKHGDSFGAIVIGAFAVGRAQTILYDLRRLMNEGRLPEIPVYVDSPMIGDALRVHRAKAFHDQYQVGFQTQFNGGGDPFTTANQTENLSPAASRKLCRQLDQPVIIVASSGMLNGGRILHHLSARLPHNNCTIMLTGFQAKGTLGRALLEPPAAGGQLQRVKVPGTPDATPVRAQIVQIPHYSAHADHGEIMRMVRELPSNPKTVFLQHGETDALQALEAALLQEGCRVEVTKRGAAYQLEF